MKKINVYISIMIVSLIILGACANQNTTIANPETDQTISITTDKTTTTLSSAKTYNVVIKNFKFIPESMDINQGETIIFTNLDTAQHTVTSDSGLELNSDKISTGDTYIHTFNAVGTFDYHCTLHPSMLGSVKVK